MLALTILLAVAAPLVAADCNPLQTATCPPIPGLPTSTYSVDFTKQTALPDGWVLADASNVTFTPEGAKFWFNHRGSAPYIWTNWYMAYGQVDVEMQIAQGTGIITSAVLFSDDADEIDWEFSGSNFGTGCSPNFNGKAFTNYFGKGITGVYDRATLQDCWQPQYQFHTYSWNWTPDSLTWYIDGQSRHTQPNTYATSGDYQYPQTPARLHIGCWDAGDPNTLAGTVNWAGGYTDYSQVPYYAILKRVNIVTTNPCALWQYPPNFSGQWKDVKCISSTLSSSTISSTSSTSTQSTSMSTSTTSTSSSSLVMSSSSSTSSVSSTSTASSSSASSSSIFAPTASAQTVASMTYGAPSCPSTIYTVAKGDYAYQIATMFNVPINAIQSVNPQQDMNNIWAGQRLWIPCGGTIPATIPPSLLWTQSLFSTTTSSPSLTPSSTSSSTISRRPLVSVSSIARSTSSTSSSTTSSASTTTTASSSSSTITSTVVFTLPSTCTTDSCINFMASSTSLAASFCTPYLSSSALAQSTITSASGVYSACNQSPNTSQLSSACSCLLTGLSVSTSTTSTTTRSMRSLNRLPNTVSARGYDEMGDADIKARSMKLGKRSGVQYNGNVVDDVGYGSQENDDVKFKNNRRGYFGNLW